jgi:thiosulfate/3-mercaptopyruvate sulfurtransferase
MFLIRATKRSIVTASQGMRAFSTIRSKYLVETYELSELLKKEPVRVVDATWYMPNDPRNAKEEFAKERITADT